MPCGHRVHTAIFIYKQHRQFDFRIQFYPDMFNYYRSILCLKYEWRHWNFGNNIAFKSMGHFDPLIVKLYGV